MQISTQEAIMAVKSMISKNGWRLSNDNEDKNIFFLSFKLRNTKLSTANVIIHVKPHVKDPKICSQIMCYAKIPLDVDETSRSQVAEYLTRVNYGLNLGNFEMDFSDGEVRYKMSCNVYTVLPDFDILDDLVRIPLLMIERYGDGILSVMMGLDTPEAAIEKAEKG